MVVRLAEKMFRSAAVFLLPSCMPTGFYLFHWHMQISIARKEKMFLRKTFFAEFPLGV